MNKFKISPEEFDLLTENAIDLKPKLVFKPKASAQAKLHIDIAKINIINDDLVNNVIKKKLDKQLQKLIKYALIYLNDEDDSDPSSLVSALDEAAKFKAMLEDKYQAFLKQEFELEQRQKLDKVLIELKRKRLYQDRDNNITKKGR